LPPEGLAKFQFASEMGGVKKYRFRRNRNN
jgi:hypothetical protein